VGGARVTEGTLILLVLAAAGAIGRNRMLLLASLLLLALRLLRADALVRWIGGGGTNWGVFLMILALLAPIASEDIGLRHFRQEILSPAGIFAILLAAAGAYFGRRGVDYLQAQPQVLVGLVAGSILGTVVLQGVPTGPLILAGLVSLLAGLWQAGH
jgi:uncharacterized membrane protein (DUF441 family)